MFRVFLELFQPQRVPGRLRLQLVRRSRAGRARSGAGGAGGEGGGGEGGEGGGGEGGEGGWSSLHGAAATASGNRVGKSKTNLIFFTSWGFLSKMLQQLIILDLLGSPCQDGSVDILPS